ncbi:uncharacterized protein LOC110094171 [Dendrobium catenatum]|uniref:uncharacterized protein LOC110094171 n=1 Tax=Dendrobium catenatum TaxID=906689 RepID=UPI0010A0614B|nr:uncharacterized protein LOC110094171 [Dendrobium catenatum]
MSSLDRNDINLIIGNEWDYFHHSAIGISGGILVMWKNNLASFEVIEHSSQLIMGTLNINALGKWNIATVYGGKDAQTRRSLWQKLEGCMIGDEPGIIGGDFNCILSKKDKKGGKMFHFFNGSKDMNMFLMNKDFHDIVHLEHTLKAWRKSNFGTSAEILQRKLRRTLKALYFWNKNKCKELNLLKLELKKDILQLQFEESSAGGLTAKNLKLLRNKVHDLNVTLGRLSTWWNQRAKIRWKQDGDINSTYFHQYASAKRNGNMIWQIKYEIGTVVEDFEQIETIFYKFFQKKWTARECKLTGWPSFPKNMRISHEDANPLNVDFTKEELIKAIFNQGNNKSPGLYGITTSFFKFYWKIVEEDTWKAIDSFFKTGIMHNE